MRMTKCNLIATHFYDADVYDSCPHCAKANGNSPASKSPSSENIGQKSAKETSNGKQEGIKSRFGSQEKESVSKKRGFFSKHKPKTSNDDRTKSVWDEEEPPVVQETVEDKGLELNSKVSEPNVQNDNTAKSEVAPNDVQAPQELKEPDVSQPSFSQQIRNVAMSGSVKDLKTVAYYNYEENSEPVVGWLVATTTDEKGNSFELKCGKNTVGRSGNGHLVDISLDRDASVSRGSQAVVIYEPKKRQFIVQNANGSSLVYYNDELLMAFNELSAYDRITIGETELLFIPLCSERFTWEK